MFVRIKNRCVARLVIRRRLNASRSGRQGRICASARRQSVNVVQLSSFGLLSDYAVFCRRVCRAGLLLPLIAAERLPIVGWRGLVFASELRPTVVGGRLRPAAGMVLVAEVLVLVSVEELLLRFVVVVGLLDAGQFFVRKSSRLFCCVGAGRILGQPMLVAY